MSSYVGKQRAVATATADERLLAELGYKQEFRREFTPFEVRHLYLWRFTGCPPQSLQIEDIRGCVQRCRTPALYRVSSVPSRAHSFLL